MKLTEVLNINRNSVISIVGAGGKTSLMFKLAQEFKDKGRVLVTTTTKIYVPRKEQYDYLIVGDEDRLIEANEGGIWIYGESINEDNKLTAISKEKLRKVIKYFDYVLIEADGSKGKALKGWKDQEPVISDFSNCTIGVLSGKALGLEIKEANIHRVHNFLGKREGTVGEEDLIEVIFNPRGMFKNSRGANILYINQIDNEEDYKKVSPLIKEIINENEKCNLVNKGIVGSLKEEQYFHIDLGGQHG